MCLRMCSRRFVCHTLVRCDDSFILDRVVVCESADSAHTNGQRFLIDRRTHTFSRVL